MYGLAPQSLGSAGRAGAVNAGDGKNDQHGELMVVGDVGDSGLSNSSGYFWLSIRS